MGTGRKAYRLHLGRPAGAADLIDIFAPADCQPSTVAEQERFFREWLVSIG